MYKSEYSNAQLQIQLQLTIINNGSYMGEEEDHWYILPIILVTGYWIVFTNKDFLRIFG